jgi:hypothetical protein
MELQLDATITVLLISKISSTCFGQTFAHLQQHARKPCLPHQQDIIPYVVKILSLALLKMGKKFARNMLSWSWRSIKLLLLHLVCVPYLLTYIDGARWNINQVYKSMGSQIFFPNSRNHLQILGARRVTWSKFHIEDPQSWSDLLTSLLSGALCAVRVYWYTNLCVRKPRLQKLCWKY